MLENTLDNQIFNHFIVYHPTSRYLSKIQLFYEEHQEIKTLFLTFLSKTFVENQYIEDEINPKSIVESEPRSVTTLLDRNLQINFEGLV